MIQTLSLSDPKTCFKCGETKTRDNFYAHPQMGDGLLGKCKECTKKDSMSRRKAKLEEVRQYDRERAKLPHRVERISLFTKKWRAEYPNRFKAECALNNAIRDGKIEKKPCQVCGKEKSEAHHEDYSKPLEVVWLCKPHHFQADKKRRERESQNTSVNIQPENKEVCI